MSGGAPLHLDLPQLRAAIAVREQGTVTRAAEALGLTQPAVSRLVATLEAELGFAVFERIRKRLLPSERGRSFLDEAQSALRGLGRLSVLARELERGRRGVLRVGAIPALAHGILARAVALHAKQHPDIVIEIEQLPRERQLEELRAGRLDVALAALPFSGGGLRIQPVFEGDAMCFLPAGHRLARRRTIRPADLGTETLVLGREDSILRQRVEDAFRQAGVALRLGMTTDSTPLIATLVAAGAGVAVSHPMPSGSLPGGVLGRTFEPRLRFTYAMVTQSTDSRAPGLDAFCATLRGAPRSSRTGA